MASRSARERTLPDVGHFYYARLGEDGLGAYDSDERARSFWNEYYVQAMSEAGVDLPREQLVSAGHALYDWYQRPEQWRPYPGRIRTCSSARTSYRLVQGVVSDWGTDLVPLLHAHEITRHLDFVVASAAVGARRSRIRTSFVTRSTRAGLAASDVIYVGDSYVADVLGARAVGIMPVLIDREGRAPRSIARSCIAHRRAGPDRAVACGSFLCGTRRSLFQPEVPSRDWHLSPEGRA